MLTEHPTSSAARSVRKSLLPNSPIHSGLIFLSIARMVWKQRYLVIAAAIIATGIGIVLVRRIPLVYRAQSLILVDSQKIPDKFVTSTVQVTLEDRLASISRQILSVTRLQKIIESFNLYPQERKKLAPEQVTEMMRKDIDIALDRGYRGDRPGAFRVVYEGTNPKVVAGVVNEVSNLFIQENLRSREIQANGTSEFIENQLQQAKKELEQQEQRVSSYKLSRVGQLPEQMGALEASLNRLQTELQGTQDAVNRAQQNKTVLDTSLRFALASQEALERAISQPGTPLPSNFTPASPGSPVLPPKESDRIVAQLNTLRARYNDSHPEVQRLAAELTRALQTEQSQTEQRAKAAQLELARTKASAPGDLAPPPGASLQAVTELNREKERVEMIHLQIAQIDKEIRDRAADRERILHALSDYSARVEKMPVREQEMASLTRDYEISKQNYKSLLDKEMSAQMAAAMERAQQSERFTLQDSARIPQKSVRPNRLLLYQVSGFAGLVVGLLLALLVEFPKGVFLGEWELASEVPVLGRVPGISVDSGNGGGRIWAATVGIGIIVLTALLMATANFRRGWF